MATNWLRTEIDATAHRQRPPAMPPIPVYVVTPAGPLWDQCSSALAGALRLAPPLEPGSLRRQPPGLVLVDPGHSGTEVLISAGTELPGVDGWTVAFAYTAGGQVSVRTLSVGYDHPLHEVADFAGGAEGTGHLLELQRVLAEIAKARHDINNPLTSALAEVQILLLDAEDGEVREGLETIQEQLRRLRDMVAATRHLRTRRQGT
jgi:signal transduction histidine kinase